MDANAFKSPIQLDLVSIGKPEKKKIAKGGCDECPANGRPGINKVFGQVRGKELFVWGMAPGPEENEAKKEFVGRPGKFLWRELGKVGIERKDVDIQNVQRCYPADADEYGKLRMRNPSKEELKCCQAHNEEALSKSKARIHLVLGAVAAKQILGKEHKASSRIMWSAKLNAKVYCLWHPSYFIRGTAPKHILSEFRSLLRSMAEDLGKSSLSRYQYIESRDYKAITTVEEAEEEERLLIRNGAKGVRVAVDAEDDGDINLCVGTSFKPGRSRVFVTDHPKAREAGGEWRPLKKSVAEGIKQVCKRILENPGIPKIFHYGSYDVGSFRRRLGAVVRGYSYDTLYGAYFHDPNAKSYGLDEVGLRMFPDFGEYKTVVLPECLPEDFDLKKAHLAKATLTQVHDYVSALGLMRLGQLPLSKLVVYNGADCDLTKRIELRTKKTAPLRLVRLYMDCAFVLDEMTPNGPYFDPRQAEKMGKLIPFRLARTVERIKKIAAKRGMPDFNYRSHPQVYKLLYEKMGLKYPLPLKRKEKPKTDKTAMEMLGREHEICRLIPEARRLDKMKGTYIDAYSECAAANGGRLLTRWNLTGTGTGRMSSGGDKKKKGVSAKKINLQNIHGDQFLQDMLVADLDWRKLYSALAREAKKFGGEFLVRNESRIRLLRLSKDKDEKEKLSRRLFGYFDDVRNEFVAGSLENLKKSLLETHGFAEALDAIAEKYGDVKIVMGFDQGQLEVRQMAQASGDAALRKDCMSGDIHSKVGHNMTGWSIEKIKKDKKTRTLTKNCHFGILFGLGANGLMLFLQAKDPNIDIDEEEALRLYSNYFKAYPGVRRFIEKCREFVEEHGYAENVFGMRRPLDKHKGDTGDETSEESGGGAYWGNQAVNTPIQGAAHQLMLMALSAFKRKKKKYGNILPVPGMEVHDAMVWWIPLKNLVESIKVAKETLEKEPLRYVEKHYPEIDWKVPLTVEGKVGLRYGDTVDCEGKSLRELLVDMLFETWRAEINLKADMEAVEA